MRILASGSILLALCLACALPAPDDDVAPEPTEATEPEPSLDPAPSGLTPTDSALTVDRCVRTAWSYYGCEASFPVQGRTWIAWACRTAGQRPGGDLGAVSDSDELGGAGLDDELGQLRGEAPAARPADEQDRYRATVCARWADYRIRGVGGAVEREAGLAALQEICDGGDRVACAHLAEILQYTDMDRARALTARACDDPERSPMVLCDDLRNATSGASSATTSR